MESIKEFPRGIKSDQAISFGTASTDDAGVRPGPGLKQRDSQVVNQVKLSSQSQASSAKLQASSKPEPSSGSQASGGKRQAPGSKLQASSHKLQAH